MKAAAFAAVISCNRLALDTTVSAKGKGGGGPKCIICQCLISAQRDSGVPEECLSSPDVPSEERAGRPDLLSVFTKFPKASVQPEGAGSRAMLAGTEELLGHLCRCKTPIPMVTAAPCPAESDLTVQTEKMRRHRPADSSPQTSGHQRWHRHVSPPLTQDWRGGGSPSKPNGSGVFSH